MITSFKSFKEVDLKKYGKFKLCYIDNIDETIYDPDAASEVFYSTGNWVTNPDYLPGVREFWAYFTPPEKWKDQWGDDWNDAPFEHNAGCPYDDTRVIDPDTGKPIWIEYELIKVAFATPEHLWTKFPWDYGCGNSPFSVEDINKGAVAWMFGSDRDRTLVIKGGDTVRQFKSQLRKNKYKPTKKS